MVFERAWQSAAVLNLFSGKPVHERQGVNTWRGLKIQNYAVEFVDCFHTLKADEAATSKSFAVIKEWWIEREATQVRDPTQDQILGDSRFHSQLGHGSLTWFVYIFPDCMKSERHIKPCCVLLQSQSCEPYSICLSFIQSTEASLSNF